MVTRNRFLHKVHFAIRVMTDRSDNIPEKIENASTVGIVSICPWGYKKDKFIVCSCVILYVFVLGKECLLYIFSFCAL
jgi:hypothetical protein